MAITGNYYGRTSDGKEVYSYTLENAAGMRAVIIEYGCTVTELWVPDQSGNLRDVVLGYGTLEEYEQGNAGMGAFIGRYANRIENACFTLNGKTYALEANNGPNHLHGVLGHRVFQGRIVKEGQGEDEQQRLVLTYKSPHGEDGFPGNLKITVTYTLTDSGALVMDYTAATDAPTIVNFTNHSYFNLDGQDGVSIRDHVVQIDAQEFCEGNEQTCPTGRLLHVEGTPFDFRTAKPLGEGLDSGDSQIVMAKGYDHNFVLDKSNGMLELAATAYSAQSGIEMKVYTTQPGMQLYTANFLQGAGKGKNGVPFADYQAVCFETQHFPCTPSHPEFPPVELLPEEEYHQTTAYSFAVK
ncbi:MAG TPA: galactose mutarotase [Candidatus Ruthenibacterium avium]|uniref:Aldose 1-epimerase n=1 Tax=Candidatus Ruthenibacterium avium TaxID=2838751 RepID=A0A9D2M3I8_9FIRM|nr:galactose mutarotase [Candidatus Ruthenibacterium avium]